MWVQCGWCATSLPCYESIEKENFIERIKIDWSCNVAIFHIGEFIKHFNSKLKSLSILNFNALIYQRPVFVFVYFENSTISTVVACLVVSNFINNCLMISFCIYASSWIGHCHGIPLFFPARFKIGSVVSISEKYPERWPWSQSYVRWSSHEVIDNDGPERGGIYFT